MKLALMIGAQDAVPGEGYLNIPTGPYAQSLALADAMGFDGVEVLLGMPTVSEIDDLRSALSRTGLTVAAVNSGQLYFDYGLGLLAGDRTTRLAARSALRELARLTAPLSAPINIGVFRGLPGPQNGAAGGRLVVVLQEMADELAELEVDLLLEPNNDKEFPFICSTAEGLSIVERVARKNVNLMLDTFHMSIQEEDLADSLAQAMPHLRHIHLLDRQRNPPSTASPDFDVRSVLQTLKRRNYQYFLSIPLLQSGDNKATEQLVEALRAASI